MRLPSDGVVLAVGGILASLLMALGGFLGRDSLQGGAGAVMLGANVLVATRALWRHRNGSSRYPLRDARGRFVSRAALRKQHEATIKLAGTLQTHATNGMYPDGTSMWSGKGQPSPYSSP